MKKILALIVLGILMSSLVFAQNENLSEKIPKQISAEDDDSDIELEDEIEDDVEDIDDDSEIDEEKRIRAGDYVSEDGKKFKIEEKENKRLRLHEDDTSAETELEIEEEREGNKTKLKVKLSNGKGAEIKIMPSTASERALERLRLKVCSEANNCTIQLKEVGSEDDVRPAYEVQAERHAKLLGLFKAKMEVKAQIDAENGEVIQTKKPWWAFLATEPEEVVIEETTEEAQ